MTQGEGMELLLRSIPYSNQISDIDLTNEKAIYFTWRYDRFKFDLESGRIDEHKEGCLYGTNLAMLMSALIKSCNVK
jgi:hypothetical protein